MEAFLGRELKEGRVLPNLDFGPFLILSFLPTQPNIVVLLVDVAVQPSLDGSEGTSLLAVPRAASW